MCLSIINLENLNTVRTRKLWNRKTTLKDVFAKNYRGYRLNAIKRRF